MQSKKKDSNNQLVALNHLPPKKRLDAIINSPAPIKLVRSMATPDILLTIREVGAESSLELVEMLHPEQVRELFDLEIWSHDRLNLPKVGSYLSLLLAANRNTAIAQIHGLDIELIGLLFKTVTKIYDSSLGEEPEDYPTLYSISPDNRFIVGFSDEPQVSDLSQALHTFLEELYGRDLKFALRLLESVRFELSSLLEEESLKFRKNRLLDLGILPEDERLEYFSPILSRDIKQILTPKKPVEGQERALPIKAFSHKIDDRYPFLKAALLQVPAKRREAFLHEAAFASINMYASLSGDFGDREQMTRVGDYLKFLMELGLFQHCQGHLESAGSSVLATSAKYLIRLGRTTLVALRRRLLEKAKDNNYLFGKDFCHGDTPLREVAKAISLPEPRYYEGLLDPKKLTIRYFSTLTEVNATVGAINELIFRAEFVGLHGLGFDTEATVNLSQLSHGSIFARALVNAFTGNARYLADISDEIIAHIFEGDSKISQDFIQFANEFTKKVSEKLAQLPDKNRQEIMDKSQSFLTAILIQLEQNWRLLVG